MDLCQYLPIHPRYPARLERSRIDPCIPSDCNGYDIHRHYRNADYDIHIQNPNHVEKGVVSLLVDGTPIDGCVVPFTEAKQHYDVTVVMG